MERSKEPHSSLPAGMTQIEYMFHRLTVRLALLDPAARAKWQTLAAIPGPDGEKARRIVAEVTEMENE